MDSQLVDRLVKIIGPAGVLRTVEDLAVYSYDGTFSESRPDVVVLPESTEQVSQVVALAAETRTPIVARGMGSGLAAGSIPSPSRGIVLSLTRMNRILEIDTLNATVRAEAGVVTADLQNTVEKQGLFYPPDPSSIRHSTIGGNIACNAGGPRCLKYGVTGDYVQGLTVVLADGRILKTGGKPIKDVTGYDLNGLFTGSEGTLGIITEALLRLIAKPRYAKTALAEFDSLVDASRAVNAILTTGIVPATLELMDQTAIVCIEEAMHLGLQTDVEAVLLIETDGADEEMVIREAAAAARICEESGARTVKMAQNETERANLWRARRSISPSLARRAPNKLGEDISVPRSEIPEVVQRLRAIRREARAANRDLRACGRREPAPEYPVRQAATGAVGEGRGDGRRGVRGVAGGGGHAFRGTRRGRAQEAVPGARTGAGVDRDAATDQASLRSAEYPEPRKNV